MQARVRTHGGESSEWFDVTKGQREGCVLSCNRLSLLFNTLFAAAIDVVLVRFSEDEGSLRDLVHLEQDVGWYGGCKRGVVTMRGCEGQCWASCTPTTHALSPRLAEALAKTLTAGSSHL